MTGNVVKGREISSARRLLVSKCYSFPFENLMCPVSNVLECIDRKCNTF